MQFHLPKNLVFFFPPSSSLAASFLQICKSFQTSENRPLAKSQTYKTSTQACLKGPPHLYSLRIVHVPAPVKGHCWSSASLSAGNKSTPLTLRQPLLFTSAKNQSPVPKCQSDELVSISLKFLLGIDCFPLPLLYYRVKLLRQC